MPKSLGTPEQQVLIHRLIEMRETAGQTQRALAATLRVSPSWVAKVETGERRLDVVEFLWWCQALNLDATAEAPPLLRAMGRSKRFGRRS